MRPEIPETAPEALVKLMTQCWQQDPAMRPTFDTILNILDSEDAKTKQGFCSIVKSQ